MLASVRLFKAVPVDSRSERTELDPQLVAKTLPHGFVFAPNVEVDDHTVTLVCELYGRNPEELNSAFHTSFATVRDRSILWLRLQQAVHYLTTYGAEMFGLYSPDRVYIPREQLDAPELRDDLPILVIHGLTHDELRDKLLELVNSGAALSATTLSDVSEIAAMVGVPADEVHRVKNREAQVAMYHRLDLVPKNPEAFLRFVVFQATGSALLIKNDALIDQLKARRNEDLVGYFDRYAADYSFADLGRIFLRFKPIFLALRTNTAMRAYVNRIRRAARTNHRPLEQDLLNTLTARIKAGNPPDPKELAAALEEGSTLRKVRLAYALRFRTKHCDSILYRVRNGKSWVEHFSLSASARVLCRDMYDQVMFSVVGDLAQVVRGKSVYIPEGMYYALPATEKMFSGNLPSGSYVETKDDLVCGIHWENITGKARGDSYRVDLDLSVTNASGKIGWDGRYRDHGSGVYFTGDITDAPPPGATEAFHFSNGLEGVWAMHVNYYNYSELYPVRFKTFAGAELRDNMDRNYIIDPNKIIGMAHTNIDVHQKTLGLIDISDGRSRFYFVETGFGTFRSSAASETTERVREYLLAANRNMITLNDVLINAGAVMVNRPDMADIDLSVESIDKSTILALLTPQREPATV